MKRHPGITLPELMVVVTLLAVVFVVTAKVSLQSMTLYSRTSEHIGPEASMNLALKRMERVIREAMFIRVGSSSTAVEVALPIKDTGGHIQTATTVINAQTQATALVRREGKHVCFFLGRRSGNAPSVAIPDSVNGDTIFMISTGSNNTTGADIIHSDGTLNSSYTNAKVIISGITSRPAIPDPQHPGQSLATNIFAYTANNIDTSPYQNTMNAQLLRVTLTIPISRGRSTGEAIRDHTISTQFCLRNFETLN